MQYNVLAEPWIPVVMLDGTYKSVGIRDALIHSDKIAAISDDNPLQKIAILRLLAAFVSDAYGDQIRTMRDRKRFSESHWAFDADVVSQYVDHCVNDCGASFDLFDTKRPFMVQMFDASIDAPKASSCPKTICSIILPLSSANAVAHNNHKTQEKANIALTPAEALRNVLELNLFAVAMAHGIPSSVNNTPPIYYAPVCDTLFEQLVMCMRGTRERGDLGTADMCAWNSSEIIRRESAAASVGYLSAMTFRPRRIVLLPDNDGLIRRCYVSHGTAYSRNDSWHDPFVAHIPRKLENGSISLEPLRPDVNREFWRDIGNITVTDINQLGTTIPPSVLVPLRRGRMETVWSVGVVTDQAVYRHMLFDPGTIVPQRLLRQSDDGRGAPDEQDLIDQVYGDLALIDGVIMRLRPRSTDSDSANDAPDPLRSMSADLITVVLFEMRQYVLGRFFTDVMNVDTQADGWAEKLHDSMAEHLMDAVRTALKTTNRNYRDWEHIVQYETVSCRIKNSVHAYLYPETDQKETANDDKQNNHTD